MADIRTTGVLDDFNRANETPLSGGGNWSLTDSVYEGGNAMVLLNNKATQTGGTSRDDSYWVSQFVPSSGQEVEVWGRPADGGAGGLWWMLDLWKVAGGANTVSGYRFLNDAGIGQQFYMLRIDNGSQNVTQGGAGGFANADADNYIMLLRRNGGDVEGWFSSDNAANFSLVASITDSTYTGAFYVGLGIRDVSGSQINSWDVIGGGVRRHRTQIYRWVTN